MNAKNQDFLYEDYWTCIEKMLKRAGMKNVTCMLYPHARHELLNDLDKEQVLHDIEHWCDTIERRNRR